VITMEIEHAGTVKMSFVLQKGERWTAQDPHATIFQREDGLRMVGWEEGYVGPFEISQFAQAVAEAMRGEAQPT
jgi:hypothetical protein